MAITQDEILKITNLVLSAIRTNSKSIEQLMQANTLSESDCFEVSGGKRVSFSTLFNAVGGWNPADKQLLETSLSEIKVLLDDYKIKIDTFEKNIGKPDGIATLDSYGIVSENQLLHPAIPFSGMLDPESIKDLRVGNTLNIRPGEDVNGAEAVLVYNTRDNCLWLRTQDSLNGGSDGFLYLRSWGNCWREGDRKSAILTIPYANRIYIDLTTGRGYYWSNGDLVSLTSALESVIAGDEQKLEELRAWLNRVEDSTTELNAGLNGLGKQMDEQERTLTVVNDIIRMLGYNLREARFECNRLKSELRMLGATCSNEKSGLWSGLGIWRGDELWHGGADDPSAYDMAVKGGYKGTKEDFVSTISKADNFVLSESSDNVLEEIEPNITIDAIRKTEQHLSDSEKVQALKNLGNPQITQLVDFWKVSTRTFLGGSGAYDSWGDYDKQTGEFVYCGLRFSSEQVNTMLAHRFGGAPNNVESAYRDKWWLDAALPLNIRHASSINYAFSACRKIQAVVLYDYYPSIQVTSLNHAFNGCYALVCIKGYPLDLRYVNGQMTDVFKGCRKLQEVWIQGLKSDLSFVDSPLLRMDCLQYMIDNAMNTSLITITVHPDIYAKLTDEQNDEWYNILKLASSKNIQFATI